MDRSRTRRFAPALAVAALLLVTSLVPIPATGGQAVPALLGVALDKWVHAGSYGMLTALLAWGRGTREVTAVALVVAVAIGYGGGIELLQGLVPSRSLSGADVVANAAGAVLSGLAWTVLTPPSTRAWPRSEQ